MLPCCCLQVPQHPHAATAHCSFHVVMLSEQPHSSLYIIVMSNWQVDDACLLLQVPQYLLEHAIASGNGAACSIICTQPRRISAVSVSEHLHTADLCDFRGQLGNLTLLCWCLQVPQYLLEHAIASGDGAGCSIICTQPRRIAAVSVSERVAEERGEPPAGTPGSYVGYHVRLDAAVSRCSLLGFVGISSSMQPSASFAVTKIWPQRARLAATWATMCAWRHQCPAGALLNTKCTGYGILTGANE